ncbi:MAG: acireductone synthase [Phaeodactylibacter sp.]|nr:acireductone synthase [Phaeodactylibacter sp.]
MIEFILMDIEGTTTSIDFVHQVLFPYAKAHLPAFLAKNRKEERVARELEAVKVTVYHETGLEVGFGDAVQQLLDWIGKDRKHTALKNLQGYLWRSGYEQGDYKGHLYPDVLPAWEQWKALGIRLGIYSSGSVEAQQLLYGYSEQGDLRPFLEAYFDTRIGQKREVGSYQKISAELGLAPEKILFLSDVPAELEAAKAAGYQVLHVVRPGTAPDPAFPSVQSFAEIKW